MNQEPMSRMTQQIKIADEAATVRLGHQLAQVLTPGAVVSLVGTLGAGKTRLVQSLAEGLGATEEVTSPTFVLVNEYITGRMPIYHFDAYRLKDEDEFLELGPEEYFDGMTPAGAGVTLVEWGDQVTSCLPATTIGITIEVLDGEARLITIEGLDLLLPD